jgi:hypothetical protein
MTAFAYEEARLIATNLETGEKFFKACGYCRRKGERRKNYHNGAYSTAFPPPWARRGEAHDPRAFYGRRKSDGP